MSLLKQGMGIKFARPCENATCHKRFRVSAVILVKRFPSLGTPHRIT